ncbi:MAG: hypothetical protein Q9161_009494 [Pseudevernia consocians]
MSTLLSLPNEILLQIIEETRPYTIRSFVSTCKKIWTLGVKALEQHQQDLERYQDPELGIWQNGESGIEVNSYAYLSELLLKPRRALYVNHLVVHNRSFTVFEHRQEPFTKESLTMIDEICGLLFKDDGCPYIRGDEVGQWAEKLRRGDTNAVACLFLTLLPNLESLSLMEYSNQGIAEFIYKISKANQSRHRMLQGPLPLNNLATIVINDTTSMDQPGEKFGIFEACMTLPSLRRLSGKYIDSPFDKWPTEEEFPLESNVTEIDFYSSAVNAESFARLLKRIKALRRLRYRFARLPGMLGDYTPLSLKRILEQHCSKTLTHLDFNLINPSFDGQNRFIGSLRGLRVLKHLRIQGNMFIKPSAWLKKLYLLLDLLRVLPASIESLTLLREEQGPCITYTFHELRKKRDTHLPKLTNVACPEHSTGYGMIEECASLGIEWVDY